MVFSPFSRLIIFWSNVLVSRLASHVSCQKGRVNACGERVNAADGLTPNCLIVHSTSIVLLSISCLTSNLVRCVLRVAASLFRTYCLRLTRSTENKGELCKQSLKTTEPLRVSVLFNLRVSPKAIAIAIKSLSFIAYS